MPYVIFAIILFLPGFALAAVTINEVAWMGTNGSANDEWVELYNSGNTASLDGWTLSDGANLVIDLAGTLNANSYGVLERTDDSSAPGSAFLIYTGSLTNSGATLTLRRDDGGIEDQVAGGENWGNIGGNNDTKETAQYTTSGWVTAAATPGSANATVDTVEPEKTVSGDDIDSEEVVETVSVSTESKKSTNHTHISLERPDNELELLVTAPDQVFVNQAIDLYVQPSGLGERIMDSLTYTWNFGDLTTGTGAKPTKQYAYPGEYVVIVEASYADYEARERHTLTVLPTILSIEHNQHGDVLLHNNASYEVDLSGYTMRGEAVKRFPDNSFLAPKATVTIPEEIIGSDEFMTALYDATGDMVAAVLPTSLRSFASRANASESTAHRVASAAPTNQLTSTVAPVSQIRATSTSREALLSAIDPTDTIDTTGLAAVANAAEPGSNTTAGIPNDKLPYVGLIVLMVIGVLALYTRAPAVEKEQPFGLK